MKILLEKATNSISPFSSAKGINSRGKVYSDAGFKDALIFETMIQTVKDELCIFVTKDSDFNNAFRDIGKNNFKCVSAAKEVLEIIIENYGIIAKERLEVFLKNDDYIKERILDEAGFDSNLGCDYVNLEVFKEIDDGQEFVLNLRIEGIIYKYDIKYNLLANELIEVNLIDEEM
jgi:predicted nuclease of predicted toxin-antitoxin system